MTQLQSPATLRVGSAKAQIGAGAIEARSLPSAPPTLSSLPFNS